jgi:putative tryptophan/tyrosine transport system substrate-binding protein
MADIGRRGFVGLFPGAAAGPVTVGAQQPAMPVVGFLSPGSPEPLRRQLSAFREGMRTAGAIEGQNVAVEYRFAEGHLDGVPALMSGLLQRQLNVLVVTGLPVAAAAKQATLITPIVFSVGGDPVEFGLVPALNQPGGNVTGVYQFATGLESKRLGLLHELVPAAKTIAVLVDTNYVSADNQLRDVQEAAARLGVELALARFNPESDLSVAFSRLVREQVGALLVCASPSFNRRREQLVVLAARHALPAIYEWRDFAAAGGLMSYGTRLADAYQQAGIYAGRILAGAKPADLPIVQLTRFEFVINLSTARALGIDMPPMLLARADEVIE